MAAEYRMLSKKGKYQSLKPSGIGCLADWYAGMM
jgi:hypothetical protein